MHSALKFSIVFAFLISIKILRSFLQTSPDERLMESKSLFLIQKKKLQKGVYFKMFIL